MARIDRDGVAHGGKKPAAPTTSALKRRLRIAGRLNRPSHRVGGRPCHVQASEA
jgi:hypothetical protein